MQKGGNWLSLYSEAMEGTHNGHSSMLPRVQSSFKQDGFWKSCFSVSSQTSPSLQKKHTFSLVFLLLHPIYLLTSHQVDWLNYPFDFCCHLLGEEPTMWKAPQEREAKDRNIAKNREISRELCPWETWIQMFYTWNKPQEINESS